MDTAVMLSGALAAAERRRVVAFAILVVWWAGDQCASASLDGVEPTAALPAECFVTATALRVDSIRQTGILPAPARKATLGSTARKSVRESARAMEHVDRMEKEMEELEELEEMEEMEELEEKRRATAILGSLVPCARLRCVPISAVAMESVTRMESVSVRMVLVVMRVT